MPSHTVRVLCEARSQSRTVRDAATGEAPFAWRGSSLVFQLGLVDNGQHLLAAGVGQIIVEVKALNATSADDSLMRKEYEAADCDATFTAADWTGGSKQLLAATFTAAEAAIPPGNYRFIVRHIADDETEMTHISSEFRLLDPQSGSEGIDAPPVAWEYLEALPIVRVDIEQTFTSAEKRRGRGNLGIPEAMINVAADHGAPADGVTDATAAIITAFTALEASTTIHRLHFPAGTYLLASRTADANTHTANGRNLILGTADLAGRDIWITGDPGSVILQNNGTVRTHLLVAKASFRSLTVEGIRFEKVSTALAATVAEPNGNDAIALVRVDSREIEHVTLDGCVFCNTHGTLFTYGSNYDVRGKLKRLVIKGCRLQNPWGANTTDSGSSFGGGQQIYLSPWIGTASIVWNAFEGASSDLTADAFAPGGKLKDAAFFGAPMHLEFENNVVRGHGVEVVYATATHNYLGTTGSTFTVPAADGVTTATVTLAAASAASGPGTLAAGMDICIQANGRYEVTAYNAGTRVVTLVNHGASGNPAPATVVAADKFVYLDALNDATLRITGNDIDCTMPVGAHAATAAFGIVPSVRGIVEGNTVRGCDVGIYTYAIISTPTFDQARGLIISGNHITTRENSGAAISAYGIGLRTDDPVIEGNAVIIPHPTKTLGIWVNGARSRIRGNSVISLTAAANGYTDAERVVGIGVGNNSTATVADGNTTIGCDVGIGSGQHSQNLPITILSHTSVSDVLAIDKQALVVMPKTGAETSPQFSAYLSANYSLPSGAYTRIPFNTKESGFLDSAYLDGSTVAQIESATAAGTVSGSGDASVTVTGVGITGSPLLVPVAVTNTDTPTVWAGKVRAALAGTAAIPALYTVGGSGTAITVTRNTLGARDETLNIALATGTATGITAAPTSTDVTLAFRWTPTVAGRYLVPAQVNFGSVGSGTTIAWQIRRNGTAVKTPFNEIRTSTAANCTSPSMVIVNMNGTTDYLELWAYQDSGVSKDIIGGATASYFQAALLP